MLVLGRKVGEWIQIGEWEVHVLRVRERMVRLLILCQGNYLKCDVELLGVYLLTENIELNVCRIEHGRVSLGITAPKNVLILRGELT